MNSVLSFWALRRGENDDQTKAKNSFPTARARSRLSFANASPKTSLIITVEVRVIDGLCRLLAAVSTSRTGCWTPAAALQHPATATATCRVGYECDKDVVPADRVRCCCRSTLAARGCAPAAVAPFRQRSAAPTPSLRFDKAVLLPAGKD